MSPCHLCGEPITDRFPRTRGDEPHIDALAASVGGFSPHTRG